MGQAVFFDIECSERGEGQARGPRRARQQALGSAAMPMVMLVPLEAMLFDMAVGRAVVVLAAAVPVAAAIVAIFGKYVAQKAAGRGTADGVERVALRNDGPGGRAQAGADEGVVGFAVAGVCAAGHGEGQQADQTEARDVGSYVHVRLHSHCMMVEA